MRDFTVIHDFIVECESKNSWRSLVWIPFCHFGVGDDKVMVVPVCQTSSFTPPQSSCLNASKENQKAVFTHVWIFITEDNKKKSKWARDTENDKNN